MILAGCFNGTKTYMPKDQGKFDFSCHDPFNNIKISHDYPTFLPQYHGADS